MEQVVTRQREKRMKVPHIYLLLFSIIVICAILTWILPAGVFDKQVNESGIEVAVPGTFHYVESSPVGPFETVQSLYEGMIDAGPIIFFVFISYASINLIIDSGAVNGLVAKTLMKVKGRGRVWVIPIFIFLIGLISSTIGCFEELLPFVPVFVGIATAMGFDAMVGLAIIGLALGLGYSGAIMNPFTVGVAQEIADLPPLSGAGFRFISHLVLVLVGSIYVMRYALKVQADPKASLVYGDKSKAEMTDKDLENSQFGVREILVLIVLTIGVVTIILGSKNRGWYLGEINAAFFIMGIITAIIMGWKPNEVAKRFEKSFMDVTTACLMIGIARGIMVVLSQGKIVDTIVYGLSIPLSYLPKLLLGPAMVVFETLLNLFIPSGSGQAVVAMPIMAPLGDLLGMSRQVSVLAFQFGDGLSNILWPTAFAPILTGLAGVKLDKWWKFLIPCFLWLLLTQFILIAIAITIGYA